MNGPVVVIDNGGSQCRMGLAGEDAPRKCFQNAAAKAKGERTPLIGDMIDNAKVITQLNVRRPFDRGYLVNWDLESEIWARGFKHFLPDVSVSEASLLMTEPLFNLPAIQRKTQEVVFEHFGFQAMHAEPAPVLALHQYAVENPEDPLARSLSGVVVDAGYSFTHAVPIFDGRVQFEAVKRVNIGGKALTNLLKELVSYRSMNLKDEALLVDLVKEAVSFVSMDVRADLARCHPPKKSQLSLEFVLPDGVHNLRGWARDPRDPEVIRKKEEQRAEEAQLPRQEQSIGEQVLLINNERFMVPEVLFHPSDIGLLQAGICETIHQAVSASHAVLQPLLSQNVLLAGGVSQCPNFRARVARDLRPFVDIGDTLCVNTVQDAVLGAWQGASQLGAAGYFSDVAVTTQQYAEHGAGRRPFM